jgi:phosphatidylglycerophosphate synthase
MNIPPDSYSRLERLWVDPARKILRVVYAPLVRVLAALRVSPNAVSFTQVIVGGIVVAIIPSQPRVAFVLFIAAVLLDGLDGALARATGRVSKFGALFDQYCDHIREVLVVAGLALHGALNPFLAGLYGLTYPAFNLTIFLCNSYRAPLPVAIKSYMIVYPVMFAYLWFGLNFMDRGVGLSITLMWIVIAQGVIKLHGAMGSA